MGRKITVSYAAYAQFKISSKIPLLSVEENGAITGENIPYSWWIRYDILYYYDENGKINEIEANTIDYDNKNPDNYESDTDDFDTDSDSDSNTDSDTDTDSDDE